MTPPVQVVRTPAANTDRLLGALRRAGARTASRAPARLRADAGPIVLPGVSSFPTIAGALAPARSELRRAARSGVPLLGICAGLQVLFETSEEGPGEGLAILPGRVRRLASRRRPHLGWARLDREGPGPLGGALEASAYAYFAHSYRVPGPSAGTVFSSVHRRERFPSAIAVGNVWGTQFHPELSGAVGAAVLADFVRSAGATRR